MAIDAKQFNGTLGSAKEIAAWGGEQVVYGPGYVENDADPAAVNIVSTVNDAPFYTDVPSGDWVVKAADGRIATFTDAQFRIAFPDFAA